MTSVRTLAGSCSQMAIFSILSCFRMYFNRSSGIRCRMSLKAGAFSADTISISLHIRVRIRSMLVSRDEKLTSTGQSKVVCIRASLYKISQRIEGISIDEALIPFGEGKIAVFPSSLSLYERWSVLTYCAMIAINLLPTFSRWIAFSNPGSLAQYQISDLD